MYILRGWRQSDVGADRVGADGIGADESTYVSVSQEKILSWCKYCTVLQEHSKCSAITWFATTGVRGKDALFGDKFIQRTKSLLNDWIHSNKLHKQKVQKQSFISI